MSQSIDWRNWDAKTRKVLFALLNVDFIHSHSHQNDDIAILVDLYSLYAHYIP